MIQTSLSLLSLTALAVAGAALPPALRAEAGTPSQTTTVTCHGLQATIVGDARANVLRGTEQRDVIVGLGGADRIKAREGRDVVCGGGGADYILGGSGVDRVYGGAGRGHGPVLGRGPGLRRPRW